MEAYVSTDFSELLPDRKMEIDRSRREFRKIFYADRAIYRPLFLANEIAKMDQAPTEKIRLDP